MTDEAGSTRARRQVLHSLQRELAAAQDEQIARVLAIVDRLVDRLAVRGEADRLIAPLRGRLAELRPRRPLSLPRLLVMPLEPLIVEAAAWSAEAPSIPRTALAPLAQQVVQSLGAGAETIGAASAGLLRNDELASIVAAGEPLWMQAAASLRGAPVPPEWAAATGLGAREHAALAASTAALLEQASPLLRIVVQAKAGIDPEPTALGAILAAVVPAGSLALTMMMAMALAWLPQPEQWVRAADEFAARQDDPALRACADRAVDFTLDSIARSPLAVASVDLATRHVRRIAVTLHDLAQCSQQRALRGSRIETIRRRVDVACRDRFACDLQAQLIAPSPGMLAGDDEAMAALEATARDLRCFETCARQIGGPEHYDRALQRAAEALRPAADEDAVARIGRIRLIEILRGPDAAMALLSASVT